MATKMKYFYSAVFLLFSSQSFSQNLNEWIMEHGPGGYFPEDGEYRVFTDVCNKHTCFDLVYVSYIVGTKGMRRLAVVSKKRELIGVYSGFNEDPIELRGTSLVFPISEYGSEFGFKIDFSGKLPPEEAYLDGEFFTLESQP